MPISREKRPRIPRTEDWQTIQQRSLWLEQVTYEMIRPVVLVSLLAAWCVRQAVILNMVNGIDTQRELKTFVFKRRFW